MSRDWRLRLDDMLAAVNRSIAFTAGMSLEEFRADERTVNTVLFDLMAIGEAASRLPEEVRSREPSGPLARPGAPPRLTTRWPLQSFGSGSCLYQMERTP